MQSERLLECWELRARKELDSQGLDEQSSGEEEQLQDIAYNLQFLILIKVSGDALEVID